MARAKSQYDAVIVGAGPNGLAAAITLAQAGLSTLLVEAHDTPGGAARSQLLTVPGFKHDVCSAVHPLGSASPFFATLHLERHGLTWLDSPTPLAHLLDDRRAVALERSIDATADQFGHDRGAYSSLMRPFAERFEELIAMVLGPLRFPSSPWLFARFGLHALRSMTGLARNRFRSDEPAALLGGIAAHAMVPLDHVASCSFALVLALAGHAVGWPVARGGSQAIIDALVAHLRELGGELELGFPVVRFDQLPPARAYLFDVAPKNLVEIAASQLSTHYIERLLRFRHAPGACKVDWALRGPIPWRERACQRAVTVHLSGNLEHLAKAEAALHHGHIAEQPFMLLGQPSIVDDTRAPPGMHTGWAYCHVPHGAAFDATARIEAHVERFAPGFRDLIVGRSIHTAQGLEAYDPNCVGGDISGGLSDFWQLFFRPVPRLDPYATSAPNLFLCSASTPPGGGVHGMCGYWAAQSALRRVFGRTEGSLSSPTRAPNARARAQPPLGAPKRDPETRVRGAHSGDLEPHLIVSRAERLLKALLEEMRRPQRRE